MQIFLQFCGVDLHTPTATWDPSGRQLVSTPICRSNVQVGWLWRSLTLIGAEYSYFMLILGSWRTWWQFVTYLIPSAVGHFSSCRLPVGSSYFSFNPSVREIVVQESTRMNMSANPVIITSEGLPFVLLVYIVLLLGGARLHEFDSDQ